MPEEFKAVIADTSCFILLDKIDALNILHSLFNEIVTSEKVARGFGKPLPGWIKIAEVKNRNFLNKLLLEIDAGEASAIALASELQPSLLIIDDLKGRKLAEQLHLRYTGTLDILVKHNKLVSLLLLNFILKKSSKPTSTFLVCCLIIF